MDAGTLSYGAAHSQSGTFLAPYLVRLVCGHDLSLPSARFSIAEVGRVAVGRGDGLEHRRDHDGQRGVLELRVPDHWMSTRHAELVEDDGVWRLRDLGSKNGVFHEGQRVSEVALRDGDIFHAGNTCFLFRDQVERSHLDAADQSAGDLRGLPKAAQTLYLPLARVMSDMAKVAASSVSVILGGETGTGKEVSARFVHTASKRRGNFIAVNCGALPATLVESELFGHKKGAFSGAQSDRQGLVQAADGGTLFLDEVAELPLDAQVKLLRVLQEREVTPVGGTRPIPVDLRVVAATHADLPSLVADGRFRADLYARLAGVHLALPSLRERREDLGLLITTLLRGVAPGKTLSFEREALWALAMYDWPRNIRELEQALAAASAWAERGVVALSHLPPAVQSALRPAELSEDERLHHSLVRLLREHRGNVSAVARDLDKARVQIRRWCKRFGIDPASFR